MSSLQDIYSIIENSSAKPHIDQRHVYGCCGDVSSLLAFDLQQNGIECRTVVSNTSAQDGFPYHVYIIADSDQGPLIIDPTITQFIDNLDNGYVFVGSRQELHDLVSHPDCQFSYVVEGQDVSTVFDVQWGNKSALYDVPSPLPHQEMTPLLASEIDAVHSKCPGPGTVVEQWESIHQSIQEKATGLDFFS